MNLQRLPPIELDMIGRCLILSVLAVSDLNVRFREKQTFNMKQN